MTKQSVIVIGFYTGPIRIHGRMYEQTPLVIGMRLGTEDEVGRLARLITQGVRKNNEFLRGFELSEIKPRLRINVYDGLRHDRYGFPRYLRTVEDWELR